MKRQNGKTETVNSQSLFVQTSCTSQSKEGSVVAGLLKKGEGRESEGEREWELEWEGEGEREREMERERERETEREGEWEGVRRLKTTN